MAQTIAAISTAMQKGGIAIVRLSGDEAIRVADRVFKGKKPLSACESHRIVYGKVYKGDVLVDECLCSVMRAPHSYTTEDVVEINVHGGVLSAQKTLEALLEAGARLAGAGEFTLRAFLNGRIDLTKAEAVADIINSKTNLAQTAAVNQLEGKLTGAIGRIREQVVEVLGYITVSTDFPDEDADSLSGLNIREKIGHIEEELSTLLENADRGILLRSGALCAICGKPNVGKSSLLNALSGEDKAIVTAVAGTTRDVIEEYVDIGGVPVRLADTAGIHEKADEVETLGVEKAVAYIKKADICLFVLDATRPFDEEDAAILELLKDKPYLTVINKCDGPSVLCPPEEITSPMAVSAKEKTGLKALEDAIGRTIMQGDVSCDAVILTDVRHKEACLKARELVRGAEGVLAQGLPEDMASVYLEEAASALGKISGMTVSDEVINEVFSKFCIGK